MRQHGTAIIDDGDRCFIATRFDSKDPHGLIIVPFSQDPRLSSRG
jgi:hypothetical protein